MTTFRRADGVERKRTSLSLDLAVVTAVNRLVERGTYVSISQATEAALRSLLALHGEPVIRDEQEAEAA